MIETHTVDPSAASPGAILKRCREYHEITLEEAEEATKIGANYLQALEEDQIGQFGSMAYLKGFLRIYTTYLGLNPDDMIRLFDKLYTSGTSQGEAKSNGSVSTDTVPGKKFPLQKLIMPAVILLLILVTSTIINRTSSTTSRRDHISTAAAPPTPPVQAAASSARPSPAVRKAEETPADPQHKEMQPAPQTKNQPQSSDATKGFIVRMKITQSGTLTVTIDGSTSQGYDLVVGDIIEWKADRSITLELSNAGGVEVDLNGKQLKPFGQPGKPSVIVLDAEGIRQ